MRNIIIYVFVFILCGCANKLDDGFLCRYLYFPTSTNKNLFFVEVKEDRTMKVTFGDMTWDCHHIITHGSFPKEGMEWERIKAEDSIVIDSLSYIKRQTFTYDTNGIPWLTYRRTIGLVFL